MLTLILVLSVTDADVEARAQLALALALAQQSVAVKAVEPSRSTPVLTYADAHRDSLRTGKPLLVWVGGNFCNRCVEDSREEFLHVFVDDWQGQKGPATILLVPADDGHLYRAATVTKWTVGSRDWGHIPSARRLLADWRARAGQGNRAPLALLDFGDGGKWGMANDAYWRNYSGYGSKSVPMRSGRLSRGSGGGG